MSKTFTYEKIVKVVYEEIKDEYEEVCEKFEYTVEDDRLLDAVVDLIYESSFKKISRDCEIEIKRFLKHFIEENCDLEKLVEEWEYDLIDYFAKEAFEDYN